MSKITVTTIAGQTSGGDANKVKIESGDTLQVESNATVGGTLGVTGASTLTGALTANGGATVLGNTIVNPDTAGKSTFQFTTQAANDAKLIMKSNTTEKVTIHANGTTVLNGGSVTIPSQPSFLVQGGNVWTTTTSGNNTNFSYASVAYNVGTHYNTSNNRFVAPVAGKYFFYVNAYVRLESNDDDTNHAYVYIDKNGAGYYNHYNIFGYVNNGDADQTQGVSVIMDMAANDYATVRFNAASGDSSYYGGGTTFGGILLG